MIVDYGRFTNIKNTHLLNPLSYIEGQIYLILLSPNEDVIPPDGYAYNLLFYFFRIVIKEMIVIERKHGFAASYQITSIIRRRYFFFNNHNNLQILHYSILPEQCK